MTKPLTDEEFEGLKKYYESCTEPKPDVFALIATVDQLKGDLSVAQLQIIAEQKMNMALVRFQLGG
jgi:hypothetical protein